MTRGTMMTVLLAGLLLLVGAPGTADERTSRLDRFDDGPFQTRGQAEASEPSSPDRDRLQAKLDAAGALLEGHRVRLPAVFRFGQRRGAAIVPGSEADANGTIRISQSVVAGQESVELFVYGLPVPADPTAEPMRELVGRLILAPGDTCPVATVELDSAMLSLGSVNDYHLFVADRGDHLLPEEPAPADFEAAADTLVGSFQVSSIVGDPNLDATVRAPHEAELRTKCSWTCAGWPIGACACYWSRVEKQWVCGKAKSIVTDTCLGWCPG